MVNKIGKTSSLYLAIVLGGMILLLIALFRFVFPSEMLTDCNISSDSWCFGNWILCDPAKDRVKIKRTPERRQKIFPESALF